MENLYTSLAACSTRADVYGRLDEIRDRMSRLEQKAVSPADLESVCVAVGASVDAAVVTAVDVAVKRVRGLDAAAVDVAVKRDAVAVAYAPRKRRRVGSPEPSRWL